MRPRAAIRRFALVLGAFLLTGAGLVAEPGQFSERWETLTDCQFVDNEWNDGDSFHVRHAGREYIVRLYFVDTAETHDVSPGKSRTTQQARYWKVNKATLHQLALDAAAFSKARLAAGPFTVRTRWEDAKGESQLPRNFAVIETASGDLAELLVANGLARIYGHNIAHPRRISADQYQKKLAQLEASARSSSRGAWGTTPGSADTNSSASEADETVPADGKSDIPAF